MRTTIDRVGKYELRAVLARTPMSTVYDGWDSDIARRVAVKLMPLSTVDDAEASEAFARFKRGAQAAGQLNHPNIVAVYDYGETADYAYLVMEFVNGPTLKALFDENQRFALPEICKIIGATLDALQYSHDRGVVHRDVKPANIMFTAENQVKITDFGIARLEDSEMTQAGMVIGTPAYMSPEQFLGEKIDARTDVYSTGVVLYHILTGERPYEGNLATIMHKVLYGAPLLPSRVSTLVTPAIDAVVTKAMARNREDRFASAAEFNAALQAARVTVPVGPALATGARLGVKAQPTQVKSGVGKIALGAFALVVLIAGAGAYAVFRPSPPVKTVEAPVSAVLSQEEWRRQQDEELKRQQQDAGEVKRQQEREAARQQEQDRQRQEEQVRILQQQDQARLAQQQERERLQQQQEQQQQEQARLQQQQQEQARQRQEQEQARIKAAQDHARQAAAQDHAKQKVTQETPRPPPKVPPEPAVHKPEPSVPPVLPTLYAVTSTSGAAGLVCVTVTPETAHEYGLDAPQGMAVTGVVAGGAADRAGLRPRDVILKIRGVEAHDLSALSTLAADSTYSQPVQIDIVRSGSRKVLQLQFNQQRG